MKETTRRKLEEAGHRIDGDDIIVKTSQRLSLRIVGVSHVLDDDIVTDPAKTLNTVITSVFQNLQWTVERFENLEASMEEMERTDGHMEWTINLQGSTLHRT